MKIGSVIKNTTKTLRIPALATLVFFASSALAAEYHVATSGNDTSGNGS